MWTLDHTREERRVRRRHWSANQSYRSGNSVDSSLSTFAGAAAEAMEPYGEMKESASQFLPAPRVARCTIWKSERLRSWRSPGAARSCVARLLQGTKTCSRTCQVVVWPGFNVTMPVSIDPHSLPNGSAKFNGAQWPQIAWLVVRIAEWS